MADVSVPTICLSVYLPACLYLSVCLPTCLPLSVCLSTYLPASICLSVYLPASLSLSLFLSLFCISVCLYICLLFVDLSLVIRLPISLTFPSLHLSPTSYRKCKGPSSTTYKPATDDPSLELNSVRYAKTPVQSANGSSLGTHSSGGTCASLHCYRNAVSSLHPIFHFPLCLRPSLPPLSSYHPSPSSSPFSSPFSSNSSSPSSFPSSFPSSSCHLPPLPCSS